MRHVLAADPRAAIHAYEALAIAIVEHGGSEATAAGLIAEAARVADDAGWHEEAETLRGWAETVHSYGEVPESLRYDVEAFIEGGLAMLPDYEEEEEF